MLNKHLKPIDTLFPSISMELKCISEVVHSEIDKYYKNTFAQSLAKFMALVEDLARKKNYTEFETLSLISTYIPVMRFCLISHLSRTNLVDIIHTVQ